MQSIAAIGLALVIGFIYSWQLTLLVLAFAPFTLLSGFIQMRVVQTRGGKSDPIEQAATVRYKIASRSHYQGIIIPQMDFYIATVALSL